MFSLKTGPLSSHPIDHSFSFLLVRAACRGGRFLGQETVPRIGRRTKRAKCWKSRRGLRRSP